MSRGGVHNALGSGPLAAALSRAVGDTVGSSGLERYGETLTPELNLWTQPEWAYLRREILLGSHVGVGAVAAEFSGMAVLNPDASGILLVVEQAGAGAIPGNFFFLTRAPSALVLATYLGVGRGLARDSRWNIGQGGANTAGRGLVAQGTDPAAIGAAFATDSSPPNLRASFPVGLPVVLHPGQAVLIESGVVNVACNFSFGWRERVAFPGELE
jgi:hypothetical protein